MRKLELTPYASYESVRDSIVGLCEPEIAERIKPVWGLDDECEMNSAWRDCGVENLWFMLGTRLFYSGGEDTDGSVSRRYCPCKIAIDPSCVT